MTLGKLGSMYLGETPSAMNWFRVGVMPRWRKSARKPSSEMRMVVGANVEDPLDCRDRYCVACDIRDTL